MTIKSPKKLIEVALPLDDINAAAARENPSATATQVPYICGGRVGLWLRRGQCYLPSW